MQSEPPSRPPAAARSALRGHVQAQRRPAAGHAWPRGAWCLGVRRPSGTRGAASALALRQGQEGLRLIPGFGWHAGCPCPGVTGPAEERQGATCCLAEAHAVAQAGHAVGQHQHLIHVRDDERRSSGDGTAEEDVAVCDGGATRERGERPEQTAPSQVEPRELAAAGPCEQQGHGEQAHEIGGKHQAARAQLHRPQGQKVTLQQASDADQAHVERNEEQTKRLGRRPLQVLPGVQEDASQDHYQRGCHASARPHTEGQPLGQQQQQRARVAHHHECREAGVLQSFHARPEREAGEQAGRRPDRSGPGRALNSGQPAHPERQHDDARRGKLRADQDCPGVDSHHCPLVCNGHANAGSHVGEHGTCNHRPLWSGCRLHAAAGGQF
mmetsp:Transcript_13575/g.41845  ORF Transcript_13575/g.41845 Transcript_13575/m.41845 type:complete len:383 (-) Transcript_13575:240-1388(-)